MLRLSENMPADFLSVVFNDEQIDHDNLSIFVRKFARCSCVRTCALFFIVLAGLDYINDTARPLFLPTAFAFLQL